MKLKNKILRYIGCTVGTSLLLAIGGTSCSEDTDLQPQQQNQVIDPVESNGPAYYITINLQTPGEAETRATTGVGNGEDAGFTLESKIETAALYFITNNKVQTVLNTEYKIEDVTDNETYNKTLRVKADLNELAKLKGAIVKVLFIGNAGADKAWNPSIAANATEAQISDATFSVTGAAVTPLVYTEGVKADERGALMPLSNAAEFTLDFTNITGDNTQVITKIRSLFSPEDGNMVYRPGNVLKVQRAVARFDYKSAKVNDIYQIGTSDVYVKIDKMQVFNANKQAYVFKHTIVGSSTDAFGGSNKNAGLFEVAGNNWVVGDDCFATGKSRRDNAFANNLQFDASGKITGINGTDTQIAPSVVKARTQQNGYYPWCYVMENIVPNTDLMSQANLPHYATGVAFKCLVLGADHTNKLAKNFTQTLPNIRKVKDGEINIVMPDGTWQKVTWTGDDTNGGYYLTYYGYMPHNAPNDATGLQPMHYGVVRNHIYRMEVNSFNSLPDGEDPITLFVKVKGWEWTGDKYEW